jgi:fucose permease
MMKSESAVVKVLPVLFGFFVMGFCDVVGISSARVKEASHVKEDTSPNVKDASSAKENTSGVGEVDLLRDYSPKVRDTLSNLIPVALFSMFLLFSVPTGILMNRIGRKNTVLLSNAITIVAMFIPLVKYNFVMLLIAFALLGIGNTILQVSLNPLLTNVVKGDKLTSSLTAGQFVKAISSFSAPLVATFAAWLGHWWWIFPIFAVVTLLETIWLMATSIHEEPVAGKASSIASVVGILKDRTILMLFLGIVFVVGVDVGINTASSKILVERCGLSVDDAGYGPSVYFALRTLGAFLGAFFLAKYSSVKFFKVNIVLAVAAIATLIFAGDKVLAGEKLPIFVLLGVVGFTVANIFPIIYGMAIQSRPDKANEISGLMITGVFGGAVIPFFMGLTSDAIGSQAGSVLVILASAIYLLFIAFTAHTSPITAH